MANIYTSADQLIGNTPLLELTHIEKALNLKAKVVAVEPKDSAGSPPVLQDLTRFRVSVQVSFPMSSTLK